MPARLLVDGPTGLNPSVAMDLFRNNEFTELVLRSIPDVFFIKDDQYRIVLGNPALFALYPESMHNRIIGYTTAEEYDEEQAAAFLENDRIAFEKGESETFETLDFPNGKRGTLYTRKIRFNDAAGNQYLLGIARDVTGIIEKQKALEESDERYELAVRGLTVGVWDWDIPNEKIVYSPRALEVLGFRPDSAGPTYDQFFELVHPEDVTTVVRGIEEHLEDREPYDVEYRIRRPDGAVRWIRARAQAIWADNSKPSRMTRSLEDITTRKRSELLLIQQNEQLNEFAHIASHDLKAPLRGISAHVEMLREDHGAELPTEVNDRLDQMQNLTLRMEGLIVDLLKLAKMDQGERYEVEIDLNSLVSSAVELIPEAEEADIEIRELPHLTCEPVAVRELFKNLIQNALKYNHSEQKRIEIFCANPAEDTSIARIIAVRDNGIGIPKTYHDTVFKIFRRLHAKEEFGGGTGAGLTFVKRIVERHGGKIWMESEPEKGTTFFFTLSV